MITTTVIIIFFFKYEIHYTFHSSSAGTIYIYEFFYSASIQLRIETRADMIYGLAIRIARVAAVSGGPIESHPSTVASGLGMNTWLIT